MSTETQDEIIQKMAMAAARVAVPDQGIGPDEKSEILSRRMPVYIDMARAMLRASGVVPRPPGGFTLLARNRATQEWCYLNHANTWQGCPPPYAAPNAAVPFGAIAPRPGGEFIALENELPEEGTPFTGYHPDWVDDDFNPNGTRECHRYGDGTEYLSAQWLDEQDCWINCEQPPTHWAYVPASPATASTAPQAAQAETVPKAVEAAGNRLCRELVAVGGGEEAVSEWAEAMFSANQGQALTRQLWKAARDGRPRSHHHPATCKESLQVQPPDGEESGQ